MSSASTRIGTHAPDDTSVTLPTASKFLNMATSAAATSLTYVNCLRQAHPELKSTCRISLPLVWDWTAPDERHDVSQSLRTWLRRPTASMP